jgi:stress response protein YsnF
VVGTETVPVERVRLQTERITEAQEVTGTVRKEHVEFVGETGQGGPDTRTSRD